MNLLLDMSCSATVAAALSDLFPDLRLLQFSATDRCFLIDFQLPFPFTNEMVTLLEDRVRGWIKKQIPFEVFEMIPSNARAFLEHHRLKNEIPLHQPLVRLLRLDHFITLVPEGAPFISHTGQIPFFKIAAFQTYSRFIRLIGTTAPTKEQLKPQIEQCKKIVSHLSLIEKQAVFHYLPQGWIWTPHGEQLRRSIVEKAVGYFSDLHLITTPQGREEATHLAYLATTRTGSWEFFKSSQAGSDNELFETTSVVTDRFYFEGNGPQLISFLQTVGKFLTMYAFDFEVVVVGKVAKHLRDAIEKSLLRFRVEKGEQPVVEFRLKDSLGRQWAGPTIAYDAQRKIVKGSLFTSMERFVALLIEQGSLLR